MFGHLTSSSAAGPRFFNHFSITPPYGEIQRRLGYNRNHNIASAEDVAAVHSLIDEAAGFIELKGAVLRVGIETHTESVRFSDGFLLKSAQTSGLLSGCREALLMGVTGGPGIIREIGRLTEAGEMKKAVVYDAAASETVDAGFEWLKDYIQREILREGGRIIKHRFSAGYGDLSLADQSYFYDILNLKLLGVEITPDHILIPEKSVTAITGLTFGG